MTSTRTIRRRSRNRIQLTLSLDEIRSLEKRAADRGTTAVRLLRELVRSEIHADDRSGSRENGRGNAELFELILARFTKLERIQRIVLLNTAITRGNANGLLETLDPGVNKRVQSHMIEVRNRQLATFFDHYPEHREEKA